MDDVRVWGNHVTTLTRGAFRVWWRLLPLLLGTWTIGWVGNQLALIGAAFLSARWPWFSLFLLSLGFVSMLSGTIVCLRLLGRELGIRNHLPDDVDDDGRDASVSRLLALTLLPFLGIYAAFGKVQDTAGELVAYEIITRGILEAGVTTKLNPATAGQVWKVLAVVVAAYVLRRVVDAVHERTGRRVFGLVAALIEGFLMVLLIFTGANLIRRAWLWLIDRRIASWGQTVHDGFTRSMRAISDRIPAALDALWTGFWDSVWPLFLAALAEPVVWLAVAALVYGTHVLSFAEMWRKGEPLSVHLDSERHLRSRRAAARQTESSTRLRSWVLQAQDLFFGDLDDKYLPTFQSLRLILRGGMLFLGAYVLVYAAFSLVGEGLLKLLVAVFPPRDQTFWITWRQLSDVVIGPIAETLRLSLLAVAFARTLQLFKASADPSALGGSNAAGTDLDAVAPLPAHATATMATQGAPR